MVNSPEPIAVWEGEFCLRKRKIDADLLFPNSANLLLLRKRCRFLDVQKQRSKKMVRSLRFKIVRVDTCQAKRTMIRSPYIIKLLKTPSMPPLRLRLALQNRGVISNEGESEKP